MAVTRKKKGTYRMAAYNPKKKRRKTAKRKTTKRKTTKRKSTKRKTTKRKATKRKATKRKTTKRKATKRKATKRKSTKRRGKKSSASQTVTVKGHSITTFKMKGKYRWMARKGKKIVAGGMASTRAQALEDAKKKVGSVHFWSGFDEEPSNPKKKRRKTAKRKSSKRKATRRRRRNPVEDEVMVMAPEVELEPEVEDNPRKPRKKHTRPKSKAGCMLVSRAPQTYRKLSPKACGAKGRKPKTVHQAAVMLGRLGGKAGAKRNPLEVEPSRVDPAKVRALSRLGF